MSIRLDKSKLYTSIAPDLRRSFSEALIERDRILVLEGATDYCYCPEWTANKHMYLKFHPKTRELIVHDGTCAKVYADGELIYAYEYFDRFKPGGKRFEGDSWGAITNTENSVFFGGFVYADVSLSGNNLTFENKYSHIHRIGPDGRTVDLVWYDGPGTTTTYVGEVTDMLYSPKDNAVYFTRGDGGVDIWKLDLDTMKVSQVTTTGRSLLKMELYDDRIFTGGPGCIVVYNLRDGTTTTITSVNGLYIDGTPRTMDGQVVHYMNRVWIFGSGSVIEFIPEYNLYYQLPFFRFNKTPKVVGKRSQKVYIGGTPVLAVNPADSSTGVRMPAGFLMRFEGPAPQIIMPVGHTTGLETDGRYLYIVSQPQNALYRGNPVNYEPGRGGVFTIPVNEVFRKPLAPVAIQDEVSNWVAGDYYLGVPINGFSKRILKVRAPATFTLRLVFYYIWPATPNDYAELVDVSLSTGMNTIDISSYDGIVIIAPTSNVSGTTYIKLILEP
jgi:hypothetical protein